MMFGLTPLQERLRLYLEARAKEGLHSPSLSEIMANFGFKSRSQAHRLVGVLEERGVLKRLPQRARSIVLIDQPAGVEIEAFRAKLLLEIERQQPKNLDQLRRLVVEVKP